MRRRDRVEIAREVQVDVLHRHHLRVAAAGRPAFHPEAWPQRRLPDGHDGSLADLPERVGEADGRRGLAFAGGCRRHGRHENERPVLTGLQALDRFHAHLGLERAIELQVLGIESEGRGDGLDGLQLGFVRDVDVALDRHRAAARLSSIHCRQIFTASGAFAP